MQLDREENNQHSPPSEIQNKCSDRSRSELPTLRIRRDGARCIRNFPGRASALRSRPPRKLWATSSKLNRTHRSLTDAEARETGIVRQIVGHQPENGLFTYAGMCV